MNTFLLSRHPTWGSNQRKSAIELLLVFQHKDNKVIKLFEGGRDNTKGREEGGEGANPGGAGKRVNASLRVGVKGKGWGVVIEHVFRYQSQ